MPELIEVELYRRAAEAALRRPVASVDASDAWFRKGGHSEAAIAEALVGQRFTSAERHGKLLLLNVSNGAVLGLRFGMTGRLIVDRRAVIEQLEYSSGRDDPAWDRFSVGFRDGGALRVRDPRRLGGVELDPDVGRLGPDAAKLRPRELTDALAGSDVALKARLLDQSRIAGLGNLLADETLWRASLAPGRPSGGLSAVERRRLLRHIRTTLDVLTARGGSHTGDLQDERRAGGRCPRDGAELVKAAVGGRTTYWCPEHQG